MNDDDRQVLLLTCSGISHTGQLTTRTGTWLRYRHPVLITRHLQLTALKRPLDEELRNEKNLVAVDGCEECCVKKRMDAIGTRLTCTLLQQGWGSSNAGWKRLG